MTVAATLPTTAPAIAPALSTPSEGGSSGSDEALVAVAEGDAGGAPLADGCRDGVA
jgi:hypothetical protein